MYVYMFYLYIDIVLVIAWLVGRLVCVVWSLNFFQRNSCFTEVLPLRT